LTKRQESTDTIVGDAEIPGRCPVPGRWFDRETGVRPRRRADEWRLRAADGRVTAQGGWRKS